MLKYAIPILASLDTAATIAFYTEKLGFTFHHDWDGYLIFSRDGVNIHLWPTDDPSIPKNTGCYVNVTQADQLYEAYSAHQIIHPEGKLKDMPWNMRQFSILDNNGNIIHFGEELGEE
ncbi:MAG: VOC family protein [Pedobacter sp.]|nr:VOC family protein [Pedobacter sp.]MDQ8053206.1 VOC family protein [Pedobacter sp.]